MQPPAITDVALSLGIRHVLSVRTEEECKRLLPGDGPDDPLAKLYRETWLAGRPEAFKEQPGEFIRGYLNSDAPAK